MKKFIIIGLIAQSIIARAELDLETMDYGTYLKNQIKIEYQKNIEEENLPSITVSDKASDSKEVTYLLHGFMGSPQEMKFIASNAKARGSVIFNDLILGYGDNAKTSNKYKKELIYKRVEKNLDFIFKKYEKINLVGFSTGGLLISKYINSHKNFRSKIAKIRLVSPFYFSHFSFTPWVGTIINLFTDEIPVESFYKLTGYPDVEIMTLTPNYYLKSVPIKSALEIADTSSEFVNSATVMNDLKDVEIYLTKNDQVLNWEKTETFVKRIFPNAKTIVLEGKNYPHHLMAPLVSKYADTIKNNL